MIDRDELTATSPSLPSIRSNFCTHHSPSCLKLGLSIPVIVWSIQWIHLWIRILCSFLCSLPSPSIDSSLSFFLGLLPKPSIRGNSQLNQLLKRPPEDRHEVIMSEKSLQDLGFVDYFDNLTTEQQEKIMSSQVKYCEYWNPLNPNHFDMPHPDHLMLAY